MEDFEELQGKIADLTKTAKTPGGISLFTDKDKTTYKSTYQLLKDIAEIYHDLTDKQQAGLLEALAGKRGGQVLAGILEDFSEVERAMKEIEDSAGSAEDEMAIVEESITYKLNALKQVWVGFIQDLIDRGVIGNLIDNLIELSETLTELMKNNPAAFAVGIVAIGKALGNILKGNTLSNLTSLIQTFARFSTTGLKGELFGGITKISKALKGAINDGIKAGQVAVEATEATEAGMVGAELAAEGAAEGTALFGASLSSLLPYIAIIAGIVGVLYEAKKAWDYFNVTVAETEEQIQNTSSKISSLQSDIQELEDLDYRNEAQQTRLDLLEEELRIQEELLDIQKRRKIEEQSGTSFTDQFDRDNWNTVLTDYRTGAYNYAESADNAYVASFIVDAKAYEEATKALKGLSAADENYESILEDVAGAEEDLRTNRDEAFEQYAKLKENMAEMSEALEYLREQENPDYERIKIVEDIYKSYEYEANKLKQVIDDTDKIFGTYDWSSTINSIFEHVEFEGLKDTLVAMTKSGILTLEGLELSPELINSQLPTLIKELKEAGVDADELYAYLMNLADPLRAEREQTANKIGSQLKERYNLYGELAKNSEYLNIQAIQKYLDSLSDEDFKIVAGLDIDWSTFSSDQAIARMNAALANSGPAKVDVELNQTKFSEQVNELDALQSAYEKFRDNVANEETKINLDISEVESLREKFGEIEGFDFDKFEITVTSDTSGIDDIQDAFDEALTAYANYKIELEGITEENKEMIRTQLEMEGATSESAEAFVNHALAMANAEKAIADAGIEAENATQDEIAKLIEEAEQLGTNEAELLEYLILHGNADSSVWSIDLQALIDEYEQLGLNCDALKRYNALKGQRQNVGGGSFKSYGDYQQWLANQKAAEEEVKNGSKNRPVEYDIPDIKSKAGGAGKEAGKAYTDGFKEELSKLKESYDRGEIDLKTYLARYRDLIEKYFGDTEKYAEERAQALHDYLEELKGYYDSAISGVTTLLDHKIKAVQKEKDAALKAIEAERKAATASFEERISQIEKQIKAKNKEIKQYEKVIKALEKQKKAYERQKKELEKQKTLIQKTYIDPLNEEIEAIQKAADERERLNDLMQKQYNLEKLMNQRSNLVWICQTSQRCDVIKSSYIG